MANKVVRNTKNITSEVTDDEKLINDNTNLALLMPQGCVGRKRHQEPNVWRVIAELKEVKLKMFKTWILVNAVRALFHKESLLISDLKSVTNSDHNSKKC